MPDIMDSVESPQNDPAPIQQVGVSNFRLPLKYRCRDGSILELETSVVGTVSLEASLKGINMSLIMRSFYERKDEVFTHETIQVVLGISRSGGKSRCPRFAQFQLSIVKRASVVD